MQIFHRVENKVCLVLIAGHFALDEVEEIGDYLQPFLKDPSVPGMVINFSEIGYLDSAGVAKLMHILKTLLDRHARLVLCHLKIQHLEIFQMTLLDKVLTIVETETEALRLFQSP